MKKKKKKEQSRFGLAEPLGSNDSNLAGSDHGYLRLLANRVTDHFGTLPITEAKHWIPMMHLRSTMDRVVKNML